MIIEIIGLAGSGKSTLSRTLFEQLDHVRLENPPSVQSGGNIPFYLRNTLSMLPSFSRIYFHKDGKWPTFQQIIFMEMLNGWNRVLEQQAHQERALFILDQGPVYMLMNLTLFGPERIKPDHLPNWWDQVFHRWANAVDLVVWLDAALPELVSRVRAREIWHGVKDRNDADACEYLESYWRAYDTVVSHLTAASQKLKVLRVDTGQYTLEETVKKVLVEIQPGAERVSSKL
jgi:deoxyadenosine/deoxycytidine kinase